MWYLQKYGYRTMSPHCPSCEVPHSILPRPVLRRMIKAPHSAVQDPWSAAGLESVDYFDTAEGSRAMIVATFVLQCLRKPLQKR